MRERKRIGQSVKICAVIKANGYGFGIVNIARNISRVVDYFAVARVYELVKIRNAGVYNNCIILSPIMESELIEKAIKFNGEITIDSIELLQRVDSIAKKLNKIAKIHIKVDSGMNRFGIKNIAEFTCIIRKTLELENVCVVGLYSHFAWGENKSVRSKQYEKFLSFCRVCERFYIYPIKHIASSSTSFVGEFDMDMVRLGLWIYNSKAVRFTGSVLTLKTLQKNESLGYNYSFTAKETMRVAIVDIGYGDICVRKLSNKGICLINGEKCNIIGNICMDCMFVDVTHINCNVGDKCILFGQSNKNSISICEVADNCDTIPYEILTSISERVKRIYY